MLFFWHCTFIYYLLLPKVDEWSTKELNIEAGTNPGGGQRAWAQKKNFLATKIFQKKKEKRAWPPLVLAWAPLPKI